MNTDEKTEKILKEKILKMNKQELQNFKWSEDINLDKKKENINCSNCYDCSYCSDCSDCSYCFDCYDCSYCSDCSDCSYCFDCYDCSYCLYCRNFSFHRTGYYICNIEVTKEEFEKKKKELGLK